MRSTQGRCNQAQPSTPTPWKHPYLHGCVLPIYAVLRASGQIPGPVEVQLRGLVLSVQSSTLDLGLLIQVYHHCGMGGVEGSGLPPCPFL